VMFGLLQLTKFALPGEWSIGVRLLLLAALGGLIYILIMSCIFRQETKHFLNESAAMAPAKAKPVINYLQRLLRLA
jgi:hypothetical protein